QPPQSIKLICQLQCCPVLCLWRSLSISSKGTGFSPYIKPPRNRWALAPEGLKDRTRATNSPVFLADHHDDRAREVPCEYSDPHYCGIPVVCWPQRSSPKANRSFEQSPSSWVALFAPCKQLVKLLFIGVI